MLHIESPRVTPPVPHPLLDAGVTRIPPARKPTYEALRLYLRLTHQLHEAYLDYNRDRFRRLARVRYRAATRLERRWKTLPSRPPIKLGNIYKIPRF